MLRSAFLCSPHHLATLGDFILSHYISSFFALCASGLTLRVFYNLVLHPLASFPGPFWGGVTDFYKTYLVGTKRFHLELLALHEQYGPVLRIAPNLLSFSDPLLLPEVYHRRADKTTFYSTGIAGDVAPLLQLQSHDEHAAKRKVIAPTYSMKHLKLLEADIDERILELNGTLRARFARTGNVMDLADWARFYVYDTITQLIYGHPAGMVQQGQDVGGLIQAWHDMFRLGGLVATLPWLVHPIVERFFMPQKGDTQGSGKIMSKHETYFQNRLQNPHLARPGNLFDSFKQTSNPDGTPMTLDQAERECFLLTIASQDTTVAFIEPFVNNIVQNPSVYAKFMAEIQEHEQRGNLTSPVVKYDETTVMPYYQACLRETLRFTPPASIILPRLVSAGGLTIHAKFVPEGTEIGSNPYVLHRDRDIFGIDADQFRPERWLEDEARARVMDKYDFAWGYGSRRCVGKNIALVDASKFCVQFFRDFLVECVDPEKPFRSENWGINIYWEQFLKIQERHTGISGDAEKIPLIMQS